MIYYKGFIIYRMMGKILMIEKDGEVVLVTNLKVLANVIKIIDCLS